MCSSPPHSSSFHATLANPSSKPTFLAFFPALAYDPVLAQKPPVLYANRGRDEGAAENAWFDPRTAGGRIIIRWPSDAFSGSGWGSGLAITHSSSRPRSRAADPSPGQPPDLNCPGYSPLLLIRHTGCPTARRGEGAIVIPKEGRPCLIATCIWGQSAIFPPFPSGPDW